MNNAMIKPKTLEQFRKAGVQLQNELAKYIDDLHIDTETPEQKYYVIIGMDKYQLCIRKSQGLYQWSFILTNGHTAIRGYFVYSVHTGLANVNITGII